MKGTRPAAANRSRYLFSRRLFSFTTILLVASFGLAAIGCQSDKAKVQLHVGLIADREYPFSLDPKDSDTLSNEFLLDQLIGTLVKYSNSGRIEPYLAEKWSVDPTGKRWSFSLRAGLTCSDGTPITGKEYTQNLKRQLIAYSKNGPVLDFESLVGWADFRDGKSDSFDGLRLNSDGAVVFEFQKRPEDLLEFLRMPYFGHWCEANFKDGKWRNRADFVSSGAYLLAAEDSITKAITLHRRDGWFSISPDSPSPITVAREDWEKAQKYLNGPVLLIGNSNFKLDSARLQMIEGLPTLTTNVILSPTKKGLFRNLSNRKLFASRFYAAIGRQKTEIRGFETSSSFYPGSDQRSGQSYTKTSVEPKYVLTKEISKDELTFLMNRYLPPEANELVQTMVREALSDSGLNVHFITNGKGIPDLSAKINSNDFFDARIGVVDVGAQMLNMINKMMFCSKLGVSYTDPSGRLCKLIEDQEQIAGPVSKEYISAFNRILIDDSSVLPVFHSGNRFYFSPEFDPATISPISDDTRLDLLRFKKNP